jgi:hypothetical protein
MLVHRRLQNKGVPGAENAQFCTPCLVLFREEAFEMGTWKSNLKASIHKKDC